MHFIFEWFNLSLPKELNTMWRLKFTWMTLFYLCLVIIGHLDAWSSKTYEYSRQTRGGREENSGLYISLCSL